MEHGICIFSKAFPANQPGIQIWEISVLVSPALIMEEITMWENVQCMEIRGVVGSVLR